MTITEKDLRQIRAEAKWIGPIPKGIGAWTFKKDIPSQFEYATKRRVDFGLYGRAYVLLWNGAVLTKGGTEAPIHEAYLRTGGHVMGLWDFESACGRSWAQEWRESLADRILEEMARRAA